MGSKGLWRHVEGLAVAPKPYVVADRIPVLADGKTPATDEQIESKEVKLIEYEKREYLAQHILLSTTSVCLGAKIKDLLTAEAMWKVVKTDATKKSTLFLLDAEDQLTSMKLPDNEDAKTHLSELNQHFQLMLQRLDNLIQMGSTISDTCFNIIIMTSLPESYRPTLQTIAAAKRASTLSSGKASSMKPNNLIAFILEEAQHRVINDEHTKNAEIALAAHSKKGKQSKSGKNKKTEKSLKNSSEECNNCGRPGHGADDCFSKGGGKEAEAPWKKKRKKPEMATATVAVANDEENDLFAFTCTSDYADVADSSKMHKSKFGTCIDSGASTDYSPDRSKFSNYREIEKDITTADGRILKAVGMGDLHLELPNGSKQTQVTFKNAIHAPDMAFTLLSISKLDKSNHKVIFHKQLCTIINPKGLTIAKIPHSQGLYRVLTSPQQPTPLSANAAVEKLTINEAHHQLGHISSAAIRHTVMKGFITGIDLDESSKPEFCEACAKAKSARQPYPQESYTRAEKYGDCVHWDLWGPASVKSLNRHFYVAAQIDDATRKTKLYFQEKKSETL